MEEFEQIKEYCSKVSEQIRWKEAKPIIAKEIENHLCDQRDAYISGGDNEINATQKAIHQMGDAVFVGQELDKAYKPKPQCLMIGLTGILMIIGLSINYFIANSTNSLYTFNVLPYIISFGIFIGCYYIDFSVLGRNSKKIYGLVFVASIIAIMLGYEVNGRSFWIMGRFSVSLSYLALIFPLGFTLFIYGMRNKGFRGILLCGIAYLPFAAILLLVPSISGLMLYTITSLITLCFSINRGWFGIDKRKGLSLVLIPTLIVFIGLSGVIAFIMPYAASKFNVFINPEQDSMGAGYIYCLIRDIISQASLIGKGDISQNIKMLPNISTNYSLVYIIHQFGFVVLFFIVIVVVVFSVIGIHKTLKEKSMLGSLVALTIMISFILQVAFYIADNLGYGLVSSLSLPFISYGNTALFINSALIGFMLSVFRTGEIFRYRNIYDNSKKNNSRFAYEDGKLIINLRLNNL